MYKDCFYHHKKDVERCVLNNDMLQHPCPDYNLVKDCLFYHEVVEEEEKIMNKLIKDSGTRREFESGAVRDAEEGKGRFDLLPACAILRATTFEVGDLLDQSGVDYTITRNCVIETLNLLYKYLDGEAKYDYFAMAGNLLLRALELRSAGFDHDGWIEATYPNAIMDLARHYERGAKKYSDRNWEKGIPISSFIDSALRHICKVLANWTDEDHLVAACWNIMGAMWTEEKKPELQDILSRGGENNE